MPGHCRCRVLLDAEHRAQVRIGRGATETHLGAMLGIKEYPTVTGIPTRSCQAPFP